MRRALLSIVLACTILMGMVSPVSAALRCDYCNTYRTHSWWCPEKSVTCLHEEVTETKEDDFYYKNGEDYHTKITTVKYTCNKCKEVVSEDEITVTEPHSGRFRKCLACKATCSNQTRVTNTTQKNAMKAGNLFVVWDGKLYQRQYAASSYYYKDVYYCEVSQVSSLKEGQMYIRKDGYLYDGNKIVAAEPDVIKYVNDRIFYMNAVVIWADRLYKVGDINDLHRDVKTEEAIALILDYQDVRAGKKALSEVEPIDVIKVGDTSKEILLFKWKMNLFGYDLSVNSICDDEMVEALIDFQVKSCYSLTGYYDANTEYLLNHFLGIN